MTNAPNIGSLFRTADAFGVEKLIFCGTDITLGKRMKKTSRATEQYIDFKTNLDVNEVVKNLKLSNYFIIALEITDHSNSLCELKLDEHKPIALIIGNENFGISQEILNQCDASVHINMFGNNSSMNVVQATSISLYEITKQLNA